MEYKTIDKLIKGIDKKKSHDLPISPKVVQQMAMGTIRSIADAIVELVTNSDDSYTRRENGEVKSKGIIQLFVHRLKGGKCKELRVVDFAEGMTNAELKKALEFAGETSGFEKGRSVRGLFGRGLKEAIIGLGEGEVYTIKGNRLCVTKIWWDEHKRKARYSPIQELKVSEPLRQEIGIETGAGTVVKINVTKEKIFLPEYKTLKRQVENHYSLRDINSSLTRGVKLRFISYKGDKYESPIKYTYPEGELAFNKELNLSGYGDPLSIKVYKCSKPLDSAPKNNPFSRSGLLIKTEGAILDNQFFKFENEPAALFFFGEVFCRGIAEEIRKGIRKGESGIIDPNRGGLEWRHEYCKALQNTIEEVLDPLIREKKKELEKTPQKEISAATKKMLERLRHLLNKLAKNELDEDELPLILPEEIDELTIKPEEANIEVDKPRAFSIYAPEEIINPTYQVEVESDNLHIQLLTEKVSLAKHSEYPTLYYGTFKVVGRVLGEKALLSARLREKEALAEVKVGPQRKKRRGKKLTIKKGGFISDIITDEDSSPFQRVEYKDGIIKIYIKFPVVAQYLGSGLDGVETEKGRIMLAELVGEAFCRVLARKRIELGNPPPIPGAEIDTFNDVLNELQKKYLHEIHDVMANWKTK